MKRKIPEFYSIYRKRAVSIVRADMNFTLVGKSKKFISFKSSDMKASIVIPTPKKYPYTFEKFGHQFTVNKNLCCTLTNKRS